MRCVFPNLAGSRRSLALALTATVCLAAGDLLPAEARTPARPLTRLPNRVPPPVKEQVTGPLQLVISLQSQSISVFDQGRQIATSRISSGRVGNTTPTGAFTIIEKRRFHRSNIYSNAPMPFMQRITYSGIALHEGVLPGYPASHGCIRLPGDFAARLFAMSNVGARVVVVREAIEPRPFAHPRLLPYRPRALETALDDALPEDGALWPRAAAEAVASGPRVRTADASAGIASRSDARALRLARQRSSPVSIFISRKEGRLYARQRMEPMLESPVTFRNGDRALGVHVFTALGLEDDGTSVRWNVMSLSEGTGGLDAAGALEAIDIPAYAAQRLSELMVTGSSLIIADVGLGYETSRQGGTDFIVVTK